MAKTQTFIRKCSTSGPTCSNTLTLCTTSTYRDYCSTSYCGTYYETSYYEHDKSNSCSVYCPTYNDSCYMDADQPVGYSNDIYYNYADSCSHSYCTTGCSNYSDYEDYYHNSSYQDYYVYANSKNTCSTSWTYSNYADASAERLGAGYSPTWSSSLPSAGSKVDPVFLHELITKTKELVNSKQRNTVSDNITGVVKFNRVDNTDLNNVRTVLQNLYSQLSQGSSGINEIADLDLVNASQISAIKNSVDLLAKKDISSTYVNYLNASYANSSVTYNNASNIIPSSVTYIDSNWQSYKNYSETTYTSYKNT